jgi:hypothetical protein
LGSFSSDITTGLFLFWAGGWVSTVGDGVVSLGNEVSLGPAAGTSCGGEFAEPLDGLFD